MTLPAGMPSPATSLHLASLDYSCTFGMLTAAQGPVTFSGPDPVHFTFSFETGQEQTDPGVWQVSTDYSWFDQGTVEAGISGALGQIVAAVAAMLQLDLDQVAASVTVMRVWAFAPTLQGEGVSSGGIVTTDLMPYPPAAA